MLQASSNVGAPGSVALYVGGALGAPATVAPDGDDLGKLAADLAELGLLGSGARVLVPAPRWRAPLADPPALDAFFDALGAAGAAVDRVDAYAAPPADAAGRSRRDCSAARWARQASTRASSVRPTRCTRPPGACGGAWPPAMPPVVAAAGEAAAAAEALGLDVAAVAPGADAPALVAALEDFLPESCSVSAILVCTITLDNGRRRVSFSVGSRRRPRLSLSSGSITPRNSHVRRFCRHAPDAPPQRCASSGPRPCAMPSRCARPRRRARSSPPPPTPPSPTTR